MTRKRLLWLSHIIPFPPKSGVHLRAFNLLKSTAAEFDVDLVAFVQNQWLDIFFEDRESGLRTCKTELLAFCRTVTFLEITSVAKAHGKLRTALASLLPGHCYSVRWLQSAEARARITELVRVHAPDIAHFDTIGLAPYRDLLPYVPATLGHHNIESHMLLRRASNEPNLMKKAYFLQEGSRLRSFESRVAPGFAAHITCSDVDTERLRRTVPAAPIFTVPNGVDTGYFKPTGIPQEPGTLIFLGSFNWYPNAAAALFLLREIWPLVRAKLPEATLELVGSGPTPEIRELASRSGNVRVHGFVDDIRPILERAAVYVCPIRDGGGTKLKLLDAFSMEKCVVAHPIACEGIAVTAGENVILASTAEEFAGQVLRLLAAPEDRRKVGASARQLVSDRYSFSSIGNLLQEIFRNVSGAK